MIFTAVHVTCNLDTVLVLVVKQWCASLRKKSVNLKGRGSQNLNQKHWLMVVKLLGLEDEYGHQPQGLRDLLVGLSGSHKSESGSTSGVIYDYITLSFFNSYY